VKPQIKTDAGDYDSGLEAAFVEQRWPAGGQPTYQNRSYPKYGYALRAFRITQLSPAAYVEEMGETPLVEASGKGWNSDAKHPVDARQIGARQWIAGVDGLGITGAGDRR
jgi:hypothetical protein